MPLTVTVCCYQFQCTPNEICHDFGQNISKYKIPMLNKYGQFIFAICTFQGITSHH